MFKALVNSGDMDYWVGNIHYIHSDFSYNLKNRFFVDHLGFYWGYEIDNGSSVTYQCWFITLRWEILLFPQVISFGDEVSLSSSVVMRWTYAISSMAEATAPSGQITARPLPAKEEFVQMTSDLPVYLSSETLESDFPEVIGYDLHSGQYYRSVVDGVDLSFRHFHAIIGDAQPDCYFANFFSTKDAVERQSAQLKSNNLENLSQMSDVLGLVSSVKVLYEVSRVILKRDFSVRTVLRLLSNAYLTYKFGIAPSISDAREIARKASALLTSFDDSLFEARGGFHYENLEGVEPFGSSYLVGRTKIAASLADDFYLPLFVPLERFSLLPSLSRIWALMPWSFMVDWFFNIGDQLEVLDTLAKFTWFEPSYLVHSIAVTWPFAGDFLADHACVSEGSAEEVVGYRYYFRYLSNMMPIPTPTRFGFLDAGGVADWLIAGSLVIQRLS
jgi:hypothetical protein